MDRRYKPLTLSQQMELRQQVVNDLLSHPEWSLQDAVCHLKKGLRLTTADLAKLAGVSFRTVQNIERGVSLGTVQTMDRLLGVLGLRLSVAPVQGPERTLA
ncbi:MAG: helix-turn-helix transcriptional regulator [Thiobacillus sp.]